MKTASSRVKVTAGKRTLEFRRCIDVGRLKKKKKSGAQINNSLTTTAPAVPDIREASCLRVFTPHKITVKL